MRVTCVHCSKSFSLSDESAGTHFRCPKCQQLSPVAQPRVAQPPSTNASIRRPKAVADLPPPRVPVKQRPPDPGDEDVIPMAEVVIPMAEVVSRPDDRLAQPAPWDLLSPTALPSSNVVLTPVPSQQPPRKKPVAQRKSKREREADSDRLSRFFGGLICAFFGLVMVVGAVLLSEHLRVKHNLRWGGTRWLGRVGVLTIILGIGVTLSSFRKE